MVHMPEKFIDTFKEEMLEYMPWASNEEYTVDIPKSFESGDIKFTQVKDTPVLVDWDTFGLDLFGAKQV